MSSTATARRTAALVPELTPRRWWVRALAVLTAAVWCLLALAAIMLFGIASARWGWAWSAAVFAPGLFAAAAVFGLRPWATTLAAVLVAALLAGALAYASAPPDHARIAVTAERALQDVRRLSLVDTDARGNTWCYKGCPQLTYLYSGDDPAAQAVAEITTSLRRAGWRGGPRDPNPYGAPSRYDPTAYEAWHKGSWFAEVRIPSPAFGDNHSTSGTRVEVTFDRGR